MFGSVHAHVHVCAYQLALIFLIIYLFQHIQISQVLEGVRINAAFLKRMKDSPLADEKFWSGLDI